MLKFVVGRAASGKTTEIFNEISATVNSGGRAVLIVPEQFSFESERKLLEVLKDSDTSKVSVLSFTRLAENIAKSCGDIGGTVVTDFDRIVLIGSVMLQLKDELFLWGKYASSFDFIKSIASTICEFKMSNITPNNLNECLELVEDGLLKNKLHDLSIILSGYDALLENRFIDPLDNLTRLSRQLEYDDFFVGKNVYFDNFKGFTGQQYSVIKRILQKAENVVVTLNSDGEFDNDVGTFATVNKMYHKLSSIARELGVKCANEKILKSSYYNCEELSALEKKLSIHNDFKYNKDVDNLTLCIADTHYDEVAFVAEKIHNLVRTKGYRYKDFVVIARDASLYQNMAQIEFDRNNIPYFMDMRVPLNSMPIAVFIDNLIKASCEISSEYVFSMLKTGLTTIKDDDIFMLENYTYVWKIDHNRWFDKWDMDPNGFEVYDEKKSESIKQELEKMNSLKNIALKPILQLKNNSGKTAKDISKCIYKCLKDFEVINNLNKYTNKLFANHKANEADIQKKSYTAVLNVLDSIVNCAGTEEITLQDFLKLWRLALSAATIGNIPQMLDEITFGSADRIRPSRPKVAFVIGVNNDVFPARPSASGLFAMHERNRLSESGLQINDLSIDFALEENYLFYTSVCCASDMVFISCSSSDENSVQLLPSPMFESIQKSFEKCITLSRKFNDESIPETKSSGFNKMLAISNKNSNLYLSLNEYYSNDADYAQKLANINEIEKITDYSLSPKTAKELFGENIYLSASRFDTYHKCKFSHFIKYGLRAKTLKPAELDVLKKGTIVHYVFECLFKEFKDNIGGINKKIVYSKINSYINQYINSIVGANTIKDAKFKFMLKKITEVTKEVAYHIVEELKQSDFKPAEFELKIGKDEDIDSNIIPLENGSVSINGSIDRVDVYNGYIRIIDYKTGRRKFKLPDIYFGLNLQMLIYLYAIINSQNNDYASLKPAGILYMPSYREIGVDNSMAMNGLIAFNDDVVRAMEKNNNGEFIPKLKVTQNGSLYKTCTSFTDEENFSLIFDHITKLIKDMGESLHNGEINVSPVDTDDVNACKYCEFASVCRSENIEHTLVDKMSNEELLERIRGEKSEA